jgi:hypothetical protein
VRNTSWRLGRAGKGSGASRICLGLALSLAIVCGWSNHDRLSGQEPAAATVARSPIPGEAEQQAATKFVRDLFSAEFAAAKKPAEKAALASSLLKQANDPTNSRVQQYVLYQLARELAVSARAAELACQIIAEQSQKFEFDGDGEIGTLLEKISAGDVPASVQAEVIGQATSRADLAAKEEKFDHALRLLRTAMAAARKTREPEVLKDIVERGRRVTAQAKDFAAAKAARETLAASPDDPAANLAVGRYLWLVQQNAAQAMPYLAKGSDEGLKQVAQAEVDHAAKPFDDRGIEALADKWWNLAQAKVKSAENAPYLKRAGHWYQALSGKVAGLSKAKIALRLEEINETTKVASVSPARPGAIGPSPSESNPMPRPKPAATAPEPKTKTVKNRAPAPVEMETVAVCAALVGKRKPEELLSSALPFVAPAGDGRGGANGFVLTAGEVWQKTGTTWRFQYTWSGSAVGLQLAHPFQQGQVVVRLMPNQDGVAVFAGGPWADHGWSLNGTRKVPAEFSLESKTVLPLEKDVTYDIVSQLLADGRYGLFINKQLMAYAVVPSASSLDLRIPEGTSPPHSKAGSFFAGDGMPRALKAGEACLIVGPLDNGLNKLSTIEFGPKPAE